MTYIYICHKLLHLYLYNYEVVQYDNEIMTYYTLLMVGCPETCSSSINYSTFNINVVISLVYKHFSLCCSFTHLCVSHLFHNVIGISHVFEHIKSCRSAAFLSNVHAFIYSLL